MTYNKRLLLLSALTLLVSMTAFGQATTSALTGSVTTGGSALPGVSVTISSPSLLGTRTSVSGASGEYFFPALPPGRYDVRFELEGMQTQTRRADLRLAETSRVDAELKLSAVAESITVTAAAPSVLETNQVSTNLDAAMVEQLPVGRSIAQRIQIAPGVQSSGTNGQTVINGAQSFDNIYLVNGVVVNENVRGQPDDTVIEEAIQETTLLVGGVSAEYGRFTGGVISTITKSGGNDFSGSLRDNITNDKWVSKTDFHNPVTGVGEVDHISKLNHVYEATLGGRIIRDRLWFFGAGRKENSSTARQTQRLELPYTFGRDQKRYEAKLTGNVTAKHTLVASYLRVDTTDSNDSFGAIVDRQSLMKAARLPVRLWAGHYNGVITNNFLIEAQYSQKDRSSIGRGALFRDRIFGTMIRDTSGTFQRGWAPTFCGVCEAKERNNMDWGAKGSYFLSTQTMGSHNVSGGLDDFHELRSENNYQSGSDFRFFGPFFTVGDKLYIRADPTPQSNGRSLSSIQWDPLNPSRTSDFETLSLFINDKWSLNQKWSFNLGVRYDKINGVNQARVKTADDSRISPRLGAIYDVFGNGQQRVSVSYGRYAAKLDQGAADANSNAGRYSTYLFQYKGPALNPVGTPNDQLLTTDEVLRRVFAWFDSQGGADRNSPLIYNSTVPGLNVRIDKPISTPYMDEITLGYGIQIGGNGYVRADIIHRNWGDFYVLRRDLNTGRTANGKLDIGLIENGSKSDFKRMYNGAQVQGSYKLLGRFTLGGNYTWSKLRGNVEGEEFNNATVPVGVVQPGGTSSFEFPNYPEYTRFAQNRPVGYLMGDIRHRANAWVQFEAPIPFGQLNLSVLERYHSGQSYSANERVAPFGITNPGYAQTPSFLMYYFSGRGAYRLDNISSTDFNATYTVPVARLKLFVKGDAINVLNQQGIEFVENPTNTAGAVIEKRVSVVSAKPFNPLTEKPQLGVNYNLNPNFGKAVSKDAYQVPRTYRFAVGVRF